ncbi:sigma-70 family RNA polymerase sigma factor [Corynebacterium sanguinis]|uniref:sigma-70 family RNA polymerase sigma factor n=1 Tax=Corynebacterium sanguinis TaxID=2594913 RepID=UPI0021AF333E|nr:sigma-70 family RNA polymerase sigma factor [Corynebacterium sanguinis]MCT1412932.1 sigma-70 family RNA polymerase sigma factor [Corynebacterium sanguinis]MCT1426706.1 sigma-70 family RNA polymerase sigma factor [Corynebacterium sanguinis]MCT1445499.1 sigma-70 family RNA polymerase sigma factor [Corynebacterium sanguinis]
MELSDQQLVEAYKAGDPQAFAAIVRRHKPRLAYIARRYARNEQDTQDILQEALFKASRNMHTYRSEATLSTWLHRLVMNSGYDYMAAGQKRMRDVSIDDTERVSADANPMLAHDPTPAVDRAIVMRQAIEALPAAQRTALLLIDVAGLTVENAAREMGVKPGTVKSRRSRARDAVLKAVNERESTAV